jgi:hypothetical protein
MDSGLERIEHIVEGDNAFGVFGMCRLSTTGSGVHRDSGNWSFPDVGKTGGL